MKALFVSKLLAEEGSGCDCPEFQKGSDCDAEIANECQIKEEDLFENCGKEEVETCSAKLGIVATIGETVIRTGEKVSDAVRDGLSEVSDAVESEVRGSDARTLDC